MTRRPDHPLTMANDGSTQVAALSAAHESNGLLSRTRMPVAPSSVTRPIRCASSKRTSAIDVGAPLGPPTRPESTRVGGYVCGGGKVSPVSAVVADAISVVREYDCDNGSPSLKLVALDPPTC